MDFIPAGYMTIRDAIDHILRATHGADWGHEELELEKDEHLVPEAVDENDQPIKGQYFDRTAILTVLGQVREAEERLLTACKNGELTGYVENGTPIPRVYWGSSGASTTIRIGDLQRGEATKSEDLQWQHHRALFERVEFDAWLHGSPSGKPERKLRKHDPGHEAALSNRIETVLAVANRLMGRSDGRLGRNELAQLVADESTAKDTGYKYETIRKIIRGSYSASRRLGIPGIDPRAK